MFSLFISVRSPQAEARVVTPQASLCHSLLTFLADQPHPPTPASWSGGFLSLRFGVDPLSADFRLSERDLISRYLRRPP